MALVVTARPARSALSGARLDAALRQLATVVALATAVVYVVDQLQHAVLFGPTVVEAAQFARIVVAMLALALGCAAWVLRRDDALLLVTATVAPFLLAGQLAAATLLAAADLPTLAVVADSALGLLSLGSVTAVAVAARSSTTTLDARRGMLRYVLNVSVFAVFAAALSGVSVWADGASWACDGTVVCRFGEDALADLQAYHRLLSLTAIALLAWVVVEAWRSGGGGLRRSALVVAVAVVAEMSAGVLTVLSGVTPMTQVAHALGSTVLWCSVVAMALVAQRGALERSNASAGRPTAALVSAYVQLTKPRVMSLLLATTATAMVIAARGMPPLSIFVATLLGGALMSGGAGAINHYVDRDIDPLMGRTAWRPIPSGVIAPQRALWFGIALAIAATVVLLVFVNLLATVFALLGLLGYVFIYTLWLKRSTPSNIVIGGAAGAIPPLVGWAAVTNEVSSLTAWYLFAIIFFWTPPHFWALSLLIRKHYERAGVPMLPVVRGEDETRRQIALYSLVLVALTLVLSPFGLMGLPYFASAIVLGAIFVAFALKLWREATPRAARRLYLYSLLYLFALFVAMAVDRSL